MVIQNLSENLCCHDTVRIESNNFLILLSTFYYASLVESCLLMLNTHFKKSVNLIEDLLYCIQIGIVLFDWNIILSIYEKQNYLLWKGKFS